MKSTEYHLKEPFEYAFQGDTRKAKFILLNLFSGKQMSQAANVKQICLRAFQSFADKAEPDAKPTDVKLTGTEVMQAIYLSTEDANKFLLYMTELLTTKGIALIDGEQHLTKPLIELMSMQDVENVCGEYVLNFIVSSVLKDSQRTS